MTKHRFIRKHADPRVYMWTETLAARTDMAECDKDGRFLHLLQGPVSALAGGVVALPPEPTPPPPVVSAEDMLNTKPAEKTLEEMTKKELLAVAESRKVDVNTQGKKQDIIDHLRRRFPGLMEKADNAGK